MARDNLEQKDVSEVKYRNTYYIIKYRKMQVG